jgi:hypothetical protein
MIHRPLGIPRSQKYGANHSPQQHDLSKQTFPHFSTIPFTSARIRHSSQRQMSQGVAETVVQPLGAGIVEDTEHAVLHAGLSSRTGKGLEFL